MYVLPQFTAAQVAEYDARAKALRAEWLALRCQVLDGNGAMAPAAEAARATYGDAMTALFHARYHGGW